MQGTERDVPGLSKHRIEALSDGIFAIAMTLAVLNIDIGELPGWTSPETLFDALLVVSPQFLHYAIAFLTLAAFWVGHTQQYHYIHHVDRTFIWWSVLMLLAIGMIPFTTALVGDYTSSPVAVILFAGNMFAIGVFSTLGWRHASTENRLIEKGVDPAWLIRSYHRGLIIPVVSLAVIGAAFVIPDYATALYLVLPFIHTAVGRHSRPAAP
ncbi:MAG: DUF1211 domain-containing protein [Methanomicrobiales archaeon]|nr:DUF1211 domain-containing protein [Methanomicrobiales archaeon]